MRFKLIGGSAAIVGLGVAIAFVGPWIQHLPQPPKHIRYVTVSGQQLRSVFDGLSPDPRFLHGKYPTEASIKNQSRSKTSFLYRIEAALGLVAVVHAQGGGSGSCTGCGYSIVNSNCPGACQSFYYVYQTSGGGVYTGAEEVDTDGCSSIEGVPSSCDDFPDFATCFNPIYCCDPAYVSCGDGGGGGGCESDGEECSSTSDCCDTACNGGFCQNVDPIVIDVDSRGYDLTSAAKGALFDFFAKGKPFQISWTASHWDGGFLALDRNGNGKIDNGSELFGNLTPQPKRASGKGNGFLALAVFDQPEHGGNGDGQIDSRDAVFQELRIWVDRNHNGISEPSELLTMRQARVVSIALHYEQSPWIDVNGNQFRYRAALRRADQKDEWIYDVLLTSGK